MTSTPDGHRHTDDPRWRRKNAGVMALGGLFIAAGLAILLGLAPATSNEKIRDWIAAGLVAVGIPFLVLGNGPAALAWIRGILPFGKGKGSSEFPSMRAPREPQLPEDR